MEQRGEQEGIREGYFENIAMDLDFKIGSSGTRLMPKVRAIADLDGMRAFAKFIKRAQTMEEVREYLK